MKGLRADSRTGLRARLATNLEYARGHYREGGLRLVAERGIHKAQRLSAGSAGMPAVRLPARRLGRLGAAAGASLMRARFDAKWYVAFHGLVPEPATDPFEHYLAVGARYGFSPALSFDESAYRRAHRDVAAAIARGSILCGFLHFVLKGAEESRAAFAVDKGAPGSAEYTMHGPAADLVREDFQPAWYLTAYPDVAVLVRSGAVPSALWHYLDEGARNGRSPNSWFDEQWYLRAHLDVANAKATGLVASGFFHFLRYGRAEGRPANVTTQASLVDAFSSLTRPIGIGRLAGIEQLLAPTPYAVFPATGTRRVNFMVPTLEKSILFAGYISALNFLNRLLDRGWRVRLLITEDVTCTADRLVPMFANDPLASSVVTRAEIVNIARRSEQLDITRDDSFVAYSTWSAHHADLLARAVGRRFVFFVQEYEPAFHGHDSLHAIGDAIYRKPHFALFNSELLRRYFANERLSVYAQGEDYGRANSAVFEHSLAIARSPGADELERGPVRRLLFYARPEAHASRNLFEIGVAALRRSVLDGAFDDGEWTFDGVGSLATETTVPLRRGRMLQIRPRLPLGDYSAALRRFEVGLSLQYAPHPGVVHFEMASSGMVVVTNTFINRSAADLITISPNLVPVEATVEAVARGLTDAAARSRDVAACARGADGNFVRSWKESFDDRFMATVEAELA